jgi:glucan phosphoethanolaminetransferase (alkaline phosphatase superfamily)
MKFSLRAFGQHSLGALSSAVLQAWLMVLCVALVLSVLRVGQIAWHWPAEFQASLSDLWTVVVQGARFDLKVCAAASLLFFPLLLILPARWHGGVVGTVAVLFVLASLVNLHYFGFYKTPIDPIVFGFFEDDTQAIVQTIWSDFPVVGTLLVWTGLSWSAIHMRRSAYGRLSLRLNRQRWPVWATLLGVLLAFLLLVLATKGTLRAMALGKQNVSVTTSQFLNDMVPNGVIALKFAWDSRRDSQNLSDPLLGLKRLHYSSPMEAAKVLGINAADEASLRASLVINAPKSRDAKAASMPAAPKKNLLFFMMESWSAEPFHYQAADFDVLGRLAPTMAQACHFSNFDSAQPGTHPSLEAILFSTPITPLTLGPQGKKPIPWAIPLVMQRAGYRTLFVTSARSGWRDLDRVLKTQGFDEVVDANDLKAAYPDATLGIWGVWDSYVFQYLSTRLKKKTDKPLFVFVLTSTNHPPYDLPPDYPRQKRNMAKWGGERNSVDLLPNLDSYHYATDLLGGLVQEVRSGPLRANTVIAATGDHNVRSFGLYATPERRYLINQVPFVIWGEEVNCGPQRTLPAGHRDMFPTLLPLLGVNEGYLKTGRNLLLDPAKLTQPTPNSVLNQPISLSYFGPVRSAQGRWTLGDPASFVCTPGDAKTSPAKVDATCQFSAKDDERARAQLGLLDWLVRVSLPH